jgi:hypothetical protein
MHFDLCVVANLDMRILVKRLHKCVCIHEGPVGEVPALLQLRSDKPSKVPVTVTWRSFTYVTFDAYLVIALLYVGCL